MDEKKTEKMIVGFDIDAEFRTLVADDMEHSAKGDITGEPASDT